MRGLRGLRRLCSVRHGCARTLRAALLAIAIVLAAMGLSEQASADGLIGLRAPDCELEPLAPAPIRDAGIAPDEIDLRAAARSVEPVVRTRRFEGRVVLVDFWASWCPTCEQSFSFLNALARDYRDAGLEVLAVNLDTDRRDALDFLAGRRIEFELAHDASGRCPRRFGLPGMPTAYLIDRGGRVRAVNRGFRKGEMQVLRQQIEGLLGKSTSELPAVAAGPAEPGESGAVSTGTAPR